MLLTLTKNHLFTESEDAMEEDIQIVEPDVSNPCSEWLLNRLPRLPCFANYYGQISQRLRLACQVENDPVVVSMYLQFLAHYAPEAVSDLSGIKNFSIYSYDTLWGHFQ